MTGTLSHLLIATLAFVGGHFVMSSAPVRDPLVAKIGERGFTGVFSLVAAATIYWMVTAYSDASHIAYWEPPTAIKHLNLSFMIIATIFILAALTPKNPTMAGSGSNQLANGPRGIFRITRHPMMWGAALWGILHVLANGDLAALIFFGGFAVLAIFGTVLIDRRKARLYGEDWQAFAAKSSHIPFAAIIAKRTTFNAAEIGWLPVILGLALYFVLLILHETLFGIAPISWVSGLFD
jgi:uncharacterized membrane protein|tara:strand:- start:2507 stop:3217 length:711 start_codon:yes stop_codon:yes gene_type:complete